MQLRKGELNYDHEYYCNIDKAFMVAGPTLNCLWLTHD